MQKKEQSIWTTDITPHVVNFMTMDITPDFTSEFWHQDVTHHVIGTMAMFGLVMSALVTTAGVAAVGVQTEVAFAQQASAISQTAAVAQAQVTDDTPATAVAAGGYCPQLSTTFQRGATDATTNPTGQVTELQKFLTDYYDINSQNIVVGTFGRITQSYVIRFQKEQNLPVYGIVGSLTRASIASVCTKGATAASTGTPSNTTTGVTSTNNTVSSTTQVNQPTTTTSTDTKAVSFWNALYKCVLGRQTDGSGLAYWLAQSPRISQFAAYNAIFSSAEYVNLNTSNSAYVTQLYQCLLLRAPDTTAASGQSVSGYQFWINAMQNGESRTQVLAQFMQSQEYQTTRGPVVQSTTGMTIGVAAAPATTNTTTTTTNTTPALSASCSGSPYNNSVNGNSWQAQASGGSGTYTYQWTLGNDVSFINPSLGGVQTPSVMVQYSTVGTKQASVVVSDGHTSTTANCSVNIVAGTTNTTTTTVVPVSTSAITLSAGGTPDTVKLVFGSNDCTAAGFTIDWGDASTQAIGPASNQCVNGVTIGNGSVSAGNPINYQTAHTYTSSGSYTIKLIKSAATLSSGTFTATVTTTAAAGSSVSNITSPAAFWTYLYSCVLGRQPSSTELAYWSSQNNMTFIKSYQGFFESSEYLAANTSNQTFLTQVYECVLFRAPDTAGYNYWLNQLNGGYVRDNVLQSFVNGSDFQNNVAPTLRSVTLITYANPVNDMVASVISAANTVAYSPFALAVYSLTNIFVELGIGQVADVHAAVQDLDMHHASSTGQHMSPMGMGSIASKMFCPKISRTVGRGNHEATTTGDVGQLQQFVANHFGLDTKNVVTGFFGSTTQALVQKFQAEQGIPTSTTVGPLTRAAISRLCNPSNHDPAATKGDSMRDSHDMGSSTPGMMPLHKEGDTHQDNGSTTRPINTDRGTSYKGASSNAAAAIEAVNEISDGYARLLSAAFSLIGL